MPATMMGMQDMILDRVAYGGIKDLEEFVYQEDLSYEPLSSIESNLRLDFPK